VSRRSLERWCHSSQNPDTLHLGLVHLTSRPGGHQYNVPAHASASSANDGGQDTTDAPNSSDLVDDQLATGDDAFHPAETEDEDRVVFDGPQSSDEDLETPPRKKRKTANRRKPTSKPRKTRKPVSRPINRGGSGASLPTSKFATRAEKGKQSTHPGRRVFKSSETLHETQAAGHTTSEGRILDQTESSYLRLLSRLEQDPLLQKPFSLSEDTKSTDIQISKGFKRIIDEDEEEAAGSDDESAAGKLEQLVSFNGLDRNLKPLHKIDEIFDDLTEKAMSLGLNDFLHCLGQQELKVATLCSGTESPLLALRMIQDSKYIFPIALRTC
jgi:hypothetical protein